MDATILAAGTGRRLSPFTREHPKCLLSFGGTTLVHRPPKIARVAAFVAHLAHQVEADIAQEYGTRPLQRTILTAPLLRGIMA